MHEIFHYKVKFTHVVACLSPEIDVNVRSDKEEEMRFYIYINHYYRYLDGMELSRQDEIQSRHDETFWQDRGRLDEYIYISYCHFPDLDFDTCRLQYQTDRF